MYMVVLFFKFYLLNMFGYELWIFMYTCIAMERLLFSGAERELNEAKLTQFERIVLHYMDFVQKQKVRDVNSFILYCILIF